MVPAERGWKLGSHERINKILTRYPADALCRYFYLVCT